MRAVSTMAVAALALLVGCNKPDKVTVKSNGSTVVVDGDHVTVKSGDGATVEARGAEVTLVPGAPAFVTAYPGATVEVNANAGTQTEQVVSFSTADAPAKVVGFYKDKARAAGLTEVTDANSDGTYAFTARSPDGARSLQVTASADEDGSTVANVAWKG